MDVGAIISIADITIRACVSLARFIERCRHAGETRDSVQTKLDLLRGLLAAVTTATTTREGQLDIKPVGDGEKALLIKLLKLALERCKATVEKMATELQQMGNEGTGLNRRELVRLQARLDRQKSAMAAFEKDIDADIAAIQLLLNCLSL